MSVAAVLEQKLTEQLNPVKLVVSDDSHKHKGHAGWREGGETHFRIEVVSERFAGRSRVERQRMVYDILADEMRDRVHALQLTTRTPAEENAR